MDDQASNSGAALPPERIASGDAAMIDSTQPARLFVGTTVRYPGEE
jgi:hypothetical protein